MKSKRWIKQKIGFTKVHRQKKRRLKFYYKNKAEYELIHAF